MESAALTRASRPLDEESRESLRALRGTGAGRDAAVARLHALIELVERGCPPALAVRILAPLEDRGAA